MRGKPNISRRPTSRLPEHERLVFGHQKQRAVIKEPQANPRYASIHQALRSGLCHPVLAFSPLQRRMYLRGTLKRPTFCTDARSLLPQCLVQPLQHQAAGNQQHQHHRQRRHPALAIHRLYPVTPYCALAATPPVAVADKLINSSGGNPLMV